MALDSVYDEFLNQLGDFLKMVGTNQPKEPFSWLSRYSYTLEPLYSIKPEQAGMRSKYIHAGTRLQEALLSPSHLENYLRKDFKRLRYTFKPYKAKKGATNCGDILRAWVQRLTPLLCRDFYMFGEGVDRWEHYHPNIRAITKTASPIRIKDTKEAALAETLCNLCGDIHSEWESVPHSDLKQLPSFGGLYAVCDGGVCASDEIIPDRNNRILTSFLSAAESVLYVGKSENIKSRLGSTTHSVWDKIVCYSQNNLHRVLPEEISVFYSRIAVPETRSILEQHLIKKLMPAFNVQYLGLVTPQQKVDSITRMLLSK